jgi:hypothetical protein
VCVRSAECRGCARKHKQADCHQSCTGTHRRLPKLAAALGPASPNASPACCYSNDSSRQPSATSGQLTPPSPPPPLFQGYLPRSPLLSCPLSPPRQSLPPRAPRQPAPAPRHPLCSCPSPPTATPRPHHKPRAPGALPETLSDICHWPSAAQTADDAVEIICTKSSVPAHSALLPVPTANLAAASAIRCPPSTL